MHCDPALYSDTDGGYFPISCPDTTLVRFSTGFNGKFGQGLNKQLLQEIHVAPHRKTLLTQMDDRIAHELTRAVVGDVTSTFHTVYADPQSPQNLAISKHIGFLCTSAQSDHRFVLYQEQEVWYLISLAQTEQLALQLPDKAIVLPAEVDNPPRLLPIWVSRYVSCHMPKSQLVRGTSHCRCSQTTSPAL